MSRFLFALRTAVVAVALSSLAASSTNASYVSFDPDPFEGGAKVLTSPTVVLTQMGAFTTVLITDFVPTGNVITGGNQLLTYNANFKVTFYSDSTLTMVAGTASLSGTYDATLFGRTSAIQTGTFNYQTTFATFSGLYNGVQLTTQLNPNLPTTGTSTITAGPGSEYTIDSPGMANAQYSVNGGTPINVPTLITSSVPEPATLALCAQSLACLFFFGRHRHRNHRPSLRAARQ